MLKSKNSESQSSILNFNWNSENYLNYSDWRLPNAKEIQSIVDYSRSPQTTSSAAINPLFEVTQIKDEGGKTNYPFYWSSTTHKHISGGHAAVYVCFGEALGFLNPRSPLENTNYKMCTELEHNAVTQKSEILMSFHMVTDRRVMWLESIIMCDW